MSIQRFNKIVNVQKKAFVLLALIGLWCIFLVEFICCRSIIALWMDNEFFIGTVLSSMSATLGNGEWHPSIIALMQP